MRAFLKKLFWFLLPLGIFFTPALIMFSASGEFTPLADIEELSRGQRSILVGQAYNNFRDVYQFEETSIRRPSVIALGSSRVGQFRGIFFRDSELFYNAAGSIGALSEFTDFIKHLSQPPQIIIAGMDSYFFQLENEKNNVVARPDPFMTRVQSYDPFFESFFRNGGWWKIYADYSKGKFSLTQLFAKTDDRIVIGLRSLMTSGGFTNDGSDYYGDIIDRPSNQVKILPGIAAFAAGISATYGDEYGNGISDNALKELRKFLSLCKEKNITAVGVLPPISHAEYEALQKYKDAPYASAFKKLGVVLASVYKEYGFDFYDFRDIEALGSTDNEMFDNKHGGEKLYLRLFITMAEHSSSLAPLVDVPYLKSRLVSATSTYAVFGLMQDNIYKEE